MEVYLLPDGLLFSHLPEEHDSFISIWVNVICPHIACYVLFVGATVIGTIQESGE